MFTKTFSVKLWFLDYYVDSEVASKAERRVQNCMSAADCTTYHRNYHLSFFASQDDIAVRCDRRQWKGGRLPLRLSLECKQPPILSCAQGFRNIDMEIGGILRILLSFAPTAIVGAVGCVQVRTRTITANLFDCSKYAHEARTHYQHNNGQLVYVSRIRRRTNIHNHRSNAFYTRM